MREVSCGKCGTLRGVGATCRVCARAANKAYKIRNADKVKQARSEYKKRKWAEGAPARAEAKRLRDESRAERRRVAKRKWKQANRPVGVENCARRFAAKMNATPAWAEKGQIAEMYMLAGKLERMFKGTILEAKFHVDHIVPLRSKLVCGLHTEDNLRVVPDFVNMAKGNRDWPDKADKTERWVSW